MEHDFSTFFAEKNLNIKWAEVFMGAAIFQSCDFISKTRQRIFIGSEVVARF
jgi:hypothetical protein